MYCLCQLVHGYGPGPLPSVHYCRAGDARLNAAGRSAGGNGLTCEKGGLLTPMLQRASMVWAGVNRGGGLISPKWLAYMMELGHLDQRACVLAPAFERVHPEDTSDITSSFPWNGYLMVSSSAGTKACGISRRPYRRSCLHAASSFRRVTEPMTRQRSILFSRACLLVLLALAAPGDV